MVTDPRRAEPKARPGAMTGTRRENRGPASVIPATRSCLLHSKSGLMTHLTSDESPCFLGGWRHTPISHAVRVKQDSTRVHATPGFSQCTDFHKH